MHDKDIPTPGERYDLLEQMILYSMTDGDQPIWTVEELARDLDGPGAEDAVRGLKRAGLVHQTSDGFVFATRAGWRIVEIVGKVS
jgi:Mn-dependent DtxR family transcriptional regulator